MQSKKDRQRVGREKLQGIIDTCKTVEERSLDPFVIDINENINSLREHFPDWEIPEDLCLDAETVHRLASVIRLQSDWVKHRSTSLYTDPFLLEEKLKRMPKEKIIETFVQAWHPIVALEQISLHSIAEAIKYWTSLMPINDRWKETPPIETEMSLATREELIKQKILMDKAFSEELESFWTELKNKVAEKGENGKIRYWDFVGAETYEETVQRAFMTSFLTTYGYATLEIYPLEEEIFIKSNERPAVRTSGRQLVSIPIAIPIDEWTKWRNGELK